MSLLSAALQWKTVLFKLKFVQSHILAAILDIILNCTFDDIHFACTQKDRFHCFLSSTCIKSPLNALYGKKCCFGSHYEFEAEEHHSLKLLV